MKLHSQLYFVHRNLTGNVKGVLVGAEFLEAAVPRFDASANWNVFVLVVTNLRRRKQRLFNHECEAHGVQWVTHFEGNVNAAFCRDARRYHAPEATVQITADAQTNLPEPATKTSENNFHKSINSSIRSRLSAHSRTMSPMMWPGGDSMCIKIEHESKWPTQQGHDMEKGLRMRITSWNRNADMWNVNSIKWMVRTSLKLFLMCIVKPRLLPQAQCWHRVHSTKRQIGLVYFLPSLSFQPTFLDQEHLLAHCVVHSVFVVYPDLCWSCIKNITVKLGMVPAYLRTHPPVSRESARWRADLHFADTRVRVDRDARSVPEGLLCLCARLPLLVQ